MVFNTASTSNGTSRLGGSEFLGPLSFHPWAAAVTRFVTPERRGSGSTSYVLTCERAGEKLFAPQARAASRIPDLEGKFWGQKSVVSVGVRRSLVMSKFIVGAWRILFPA